MIYGRKVMAGSKLTGKLVYVIIYNDYVCIGSDGE